MRISLQILVIALCTSFLYAQYPVREDVIWARGVDGATITMDGVLDEEAWDMAEVLRVRYGYNSGLPQSGWIGEFQPASIKDSLDATVKFLADGNYLWMGFDIPDSSIGGKADWARWDAILMSIKNHANNSHPSSPEEYLLTWWYANVAELVVPGAPPRFIGSFGNINDTSRTEDQRAAWDARWVINGTTNNDSTPDVGWTVEMRIDVDILGYDFTKPGGELLEMNFSLWDADWVFANAPSRLSVSRTSWQSMWGNTNEDNVGRVHVHPDVTINSGDVPLIMPDVVLPNANSFEDPLIDGLLDEAVWNGSVYSFNIAWGDSILRDTYPGAGAFRSGQFQKDLIEDVYPIVLDPSFGTIKMFFKGDFLYLAADINDQLMQSAAGIDNGMDGVRFFIAARDEADDGSRLLTRNLEIRFSDGVAKPFESLPELLSSSATEFAVSLKGASTVDVNDDVDEGYYVEMKVDLSYLGYPAGLGDRLLFMGVLLADGDSFEDSANDYATRNWWFREHPWGPAFAWMYMDENNTVTGLEEIENNVPQKLQLHGNFPNPFNPNTSIYYSVPSAGNISLKVFNVLGQQVSEVNRKTALGGIHKIDFNGALLSSGVYFYRIEFSGKGNVVLSNMAKMVLIK